MDLKELSLISPVITIPDNNLSCVPQAGVVYLLDFAHDLSFLCSISLPATCLALVLINIYCGQGCQQNTSKVKHLFACPSLHVGPEVVR